MDHHSQDNRLPVKVSFQNKFRRFQFDALSTLPQFKQQCYAFFKIPPQVSSFIMYVDNENDWITVEQEDEWVEAKRQLLVRRSNSCDLNPHDNLLRVRIVPIQADTQQQQHQGQYQRTREGVSVQKVMQKVEGVMQEAVRKGEEHWNRAAIGSVVGELTKEFTDIIDNLFATKSGSSAPSASSASSASSSDSALDVTTEDELEQESAASTNEPIVDFVQDPVAAVDPLEVVVPEGMEREEEEEEEQLEPQLPPSKEMFESWTFLEIHQEEPKELLSETDSEAYMALVSDDNEEEEEEEDIAVVENQEKEEIIVEEKQEEEIAVVEKQEKNDEEEVKAAIPCCRFVEHLSFPDNTKFEPGTTFTKTWKLQNSGKEIWPDVMLAYCEGPLPDVINLKFLTVVPSILPGEYVDVSVQMTSPLIPDHYQGSFRLATRQGECFGQSFGYAFETVVPGEEMEPEVLVPVSEHISAPPAPSVWGSEIEYLESMGFTNRREELEQLLEKNKGNIQETALQLIGQN